MIRNNSIREEMLVDYTQKDGSKEEAFDKILRRIKICQKT